MGHEVDDDENDEFGNFDQWQDTGAQDKQESAEPCQMDDSNDRFTNFFTSAPSITDKNDDSNAAVNQIQEQISAEAKIEEPFNADSLLAGFMADVGATTRKASLTQKLSSEAHSSLDREPMDDDYAG